MKHRSLLVPRLAVGLLALAPVVSADPPSEDPLALVPVGATPDAWTAENAARGMRAVFTPASCASTASSGRTASGCA